MTDALRPRTLARLLTFALFVAFAIPDATAATPAPPFRVSYPASLGSGPFDGRLLLILSTDEKEEPRMQVSDTSLNTQQVFGIDVESWKPGETRAFDASVLGFPVESLAQVRAGTYTVQALLHKYETFKRSDGHVVKLPMDRGEGQQWNKAPGNLYSTPRRHAFDPQGAHVIDIVLDKEIPPIPPPKDTKYIRHERIRSELLSKFWGRDMHLGAVLLLPWGFDEHPEARYPLVINHGHFPATFTGFSEDPPDPNLKPDFSERFQWPGYNRTQQEWAHQLYKDWTAPAFPRVIVIEIQHANPYYDDSYAVNSQNLGPYGDAIVKELIPYIEKKYRGLGSGWARFMYGGSTGGWEAMAAQIFYPDDFNGSYVACPDPIDFHHHVTVNIYEDENAFYPTAPWRRVPRPAHRDYLGHVQATVEDTNRLELVLGTKTRSGQQWDIWEAVYSPVGADGYPQRIFDKRTGAIDRKVAEHWRENYDLTHILRRDWEKGLGQKLEGKINIYVGDMDNYYLNNAVYETEKFLKSTKNPPYGGEVDYGDRAEHCWNGDHTQPNAISRLRYHQMFVPRIAERIRKTAPAGADLTSWRY
ncbi:MAG TPA: alpha/beta hydrolase-fold protein [Vicinamibacteria bacterium]|nr:alpha/beta hydrolase-fold protein [Vicinamibacteria bacterium]